MPRFIDFLTGTALFGYLIYLTPDEYIIFDIVWVIAWFGWTCQSLSSGMYYDPLTNDYKYK